MMSPFIPESPPRPLFSTAYRFWVCVRRMMRCALHKIRHILFLLLFCVSSLISVPFSVSADTIDRNKLLKIEAAYLYKFTKFIKWPNALFSERSDLNICLMGSNLDPLNRLLSQGVAGKQSNGLTLRIHHYQDGSTQPEQSCHLIYLDALPEQSFTSQLDSSSTLVISSPNNPNKESSLIYLEILNGKLVFFINQQHLDRSSLEINAALLSLARKKL